MNKLETILAVIGTISLLINVGLVVYTKAAISRLVLVSEELGDLQDMINSFLNHTQEVYEMEMFYGDQTLQSLMEHAKDFSMQMDSFEYIYSLTDEDEEQKESDMQPAIDNKEQAE